MADVLRRNEVRFDDETYKIEGPVRTSVSSQYPQKVVFGDVDKDSNPRSSLVVWEDWRGGIGLYSTDGKEGLNRSSFSRADGRYKNHLVLSALPTTGSASGVSGYMGAMSELSSDDKLYIAIGAALDAYSWDISGDSWSGKLHDFPAAAVSALNFHLAETEYMAFAHTQGYTYTPDGSSWTDRGQDTVSLAFWDDRLWGVDDNGQLWFSTVIGTEVEDATLGLPAAYAGTLFVGPDAAGTEILYLVTRIGLYAHNAANSKWRRTKAVWPFNIATDDPGGAVHPGTTWNGDIYVSPGGMAVYRYSPERGTVVAMGLDRDGGIPDSGLQGDIVALIPTHVGLLAVVNAADADLVWEWNGVGWHYFTRLDGVKGAQHPSDLGGNYRFYCGVGTTVQRTDLQTGQVNPDINSLSYEGTNDQVTHITPWFNAGQNEIDKTAIRVRIECTGMSATETVKVEFALNYSASYEASSFTVTSDGVTVMTFPTIADNVREAGSDFRSIRFRLTLNRGATATNTPNVKSLSLEWRRKLVARYGFEFDVNRTLPYRNRNPAQMKADIITAIETGTQVEFTFVDEAGTNQNYFVDAVSMEDAQQTGSKEYGITRVRVVEN